MSKSFHYGAWDVVKNYLPYIAERATILEETQAIRLKNISG